MPSPFPGMDPYLEAPNLWPEVHSRLIIAIADSLAPTLLPHYYVAIEQRTYLSTPEENLLIGIPDIVVSKGGDTSASEAEVSPVTTATLDRPGQPRRVTLPETESIQERYLEIREAETHTVVTVLELLSSKNKRSGPGRDAYLSKRQQVLGSATHLVEVDLLRGGKPMPMMGNVPESYYRILVSCSGMRPAAELYSFNLQDPIPAFPVPLKDENGPVVDVKLLLDGIYDRAGYGIRVNYGAKLVPTLGKRDRQWLEATVRGQE